MNQIIQGDVIEALRSLPEGFIHTCVTSPPYWGLRDYGVPGQIGLEKTPEEYVEKMVEVFREVRRVLRDDGTLWLNLGDSYAGQAKAGDKRFGNPEFNKNRPSREQTKTPGKVVPPGLKPKNLVGIPWRVAFALQGMAVIPATSIAQWSDWLREARETGDWEMVRMVEERLRRYAWIEALQADGWYLRSDIIWHKPNALPESVKDRPTKAHEYIFLLSKSPKYYYDADAIREPHARLWNEKNGGSIKTGRMVKAGGAMGDMSTHPKGYPLPHPLGRNKRTVWTVATRGFKGAHFAVFPPDLIEPCILAGSPPGGIVLDPFFGSGTTGVVAAKHGRQWIGIELNPEYVEIAKKRLEVMQ